MYKKIITILCVVAVLISALFTGCSPSQNSGTGVGQAKVLTAPEESNSKQSEEPKTEKKEITSQESTEIEKTVIPEDTPIPDDRQFCTISVNCSSVLENIEKLKANKKDLIPEDGIILREIEIEFFPGESAFDVLYRVTMERNIHMEFKEDNPYNGKYIEGINYLYEMDAGALSGWMYKVNGKFPNYGCSAYKVCDGDAIVFMYTCDLGIDVGDNSTW